MTYYNKTIITDSNGNDVSNDSVLNSQPSISEIHTRIHLGELFSACNLFTAVADDGNADMLISIPASKGLHVRLEAHVEAKSYIYLYEGTSTSSDGTALTLHNRLRSSATTTSSTIYHTPTVSSAGTEIFCGLAGGGNIIFSVGGDFATGLEWVFKESTKYLLRITNKGGAAKDVCVNVGAYEIDG